jgi:broad specificity phosphatase PhoE
MDKLDTLPIGKAIWVARHGNRADFVDPDWYKSAERPHDPPLSEDGATQAQALARRLSKEDIRHVFSSPFLRAVQTASFAAASLGLPLKVEHGLCEWLNPEWYPVEPDFIAPQQLAAAYACVDAGYRSLVAHGYPEWEEQSHCWPRAGRAARVLAERFPGNMLFVCHAATMCGVIYGLVDGFPQIDCGLCSVAKAVWNGTAWELALAGDRSHVWAGS